MNSWTSALPSPITTRRVVIGSDLSKWCNVKMPLRGLRFHLHWQLEEHNSDPGGFCEAQRRFLCSDTTIQSDNWPHFLNIGKCGVFFRVNYIVQEFGWWVWDTQRFFVDFLSARKHLWKLHVISKDIEEFTERWRWKGNECCLISPAPHAPLSILWVKRQLFSQVISSSHYNTVHTQSQGRQYNCFH